jgi:putative membrane protein
MNLDTILGKTDPSRRRFGVAILVGIIAGIVSAFVKWGAEVPLPPRTFSGDRDLLNPPYLFLRDYLGVDPTTTMFTFSEHHISVLAATHVTFALVFAIGYCIVAEIFPRVKLWQGLLAGILSTIAVHGITFPLLHLTPPLSQLPPDEYISEIFGHLVWFWTIEVIRRDLRNRITREPDAEVPLDSVNRLS